MKNIIEFNNISLDSMNNQKLAPLIPIVAKRVNSFDEHFLNNKEQSEPELREKRSSKNSTLIINEINDLDYDDILSKISLRILRFQNQLFKEMNDFIILSVRSYYENIEFYNKIGKKLIQEYKSIIFRFEFIRNDMPLYILKNNNFLEQEKLNVQVISSLTSAKAKIEDILSRISRSSVPSNLLDLRNLLVKYINYISEPFNDILINVKISNHFYKIIKENINIELIMNWNENFLLVKKEIEKEMNFFVNGFNEINDIWNFKNLVMNFQIKIRSIIHNWENSTDKIFDIFFLILWKKTIMILFQNLQQKIDFVESRSQFFVIRDIIENDFINLFSIYKKSIEEDSITIKAFLNKFRKEKTEVITSYIPELSNEVNEFMSSTLSLLYNNFFPLNHQNSTELYKNYQEIGQKTILEYQKFIQILENMKCKLQPQITANIIKFVNNLLSKLQESTEKINEKTSSVDLNVFRYDLLKYRSNIEYYVYKKIVILQTAKNDNFSFSKRIAKNDVKELLIAANFLKTKINYLLMDLLVLLESSIAENEDWLLDKKTPAEIKINCLKLKDGFLKQINAIKAEIHEHILKWNQEFIVLNNVLFFRLIAKIDELNKNFNIFFNILNEQNTTNEIIASMEVFNTDFILQLSLYNQFNIQIIQIINDFFINYFIKDIHKKQELILNFKQDIVWNQNENLLLLYENWGDFSKALLNKELISQDRINISKAYTDLTKKFHDKIVDYINKLPTTSFSIVDKDSILISEDSQENETMTRQVTKLLEISKTTYEQMIKNNCCSLTNDELITRHHTLFKDNLQLSIKMNLLYSSVFLKLEYENLNSDEININWFNDFVKKLYELENKNKSLIIQIKKDIVQQMIKLGFNAERKIDINIITEELIIKVKNFILDFKKLNKHCFDNLFNLQKTENPYFLTSFLEEEIKNLEENLIMIFASLKKINTSPSIIQEILLMVNKDFNFYLDQYQFLFRNLIDINNIYLQKKAVDNQEIVINHRLLPTLEEEINDFNAEYFNLLKQNFVISKILFQNHGLFQSKDIENIINEYRKIWIKTNKKVENIILLLEFQSKLMIENNIKTYISVNIISHIKQLMDEQKIIFENLNTNMASNELITNNDRFFQVMFKVNNYLQCVKIILSSDTNIEFINNFNEGEIISDLLLEIESFKKKMDNEKAEIQEKMFHLIGNLVINKDITYDVSISSIVDNTRKFIKNFQETNEICLKKIFSKNNEETFLNIIFQKQLNMLEQMFNQILEELENYPKKNSELLVTLKILKNSFENYHDWYYTFTFEPIIKTLKLMESVLLGEEHTLNIQENFILNPNQFVNTEITINETSFSNGTEIEFKTEPIEKGSTVTNVILNLLLLWSGFAIMTYFNFNPIYLEIGPPASFDTAPPLMPDYSRRASMPEIARRASMLNEIRRASLPARVSTSGGGGLTSVVGSLASGASGLGSMIVSALSSGGGKGKWATAIAEEVTQLQKNIKSSEDLNSFISSLEDIEDIQEPQFIENETNDFNEVNEFEQQEEASEEGINEISNDNQDQEPNTRSKDLKVYKKDSDTSKHKSSTKKLQSSDTSNSEIQKSSDSEIKTTSDIKLKSSQKEARIKLPKSKLTEKNKFQIKTRFKENQVPLEEAHEELLNSLEDFKLTNYNDIKIDTLEQLLVNIDTDLGKFQDLFNLLWRKELIWVNLIKRFNLTKILDLVYKQLIVIFKNNKIFFKNQSVIKDSVFLNSIEEFLDELINYLSKINFKEGVKLISEELITNINQKLALYYDWTKTVILQLQDTVQNMSFNKFQFPNFQQNQYKNIAVKFQDKNQEIIANFFVKKNINYLKENLKNNTEAINKVLLEPLFLSLVEYSNEITEREELTELYSNILSISYFILENDINEKKDAFLSETKTTKSNDLPTMFDEFLKIIKLLLLIYIQVINIKTMSGLFESIDFLGNKYEPIQWPTKEIIFNIKGERKIDLPIAMELFQPINAWKAVISEEKEISLSPVTGNHDIKTEVKNAWKILNDGSKLKGAFERPNNISKLGRNLQNWEITLIILSCFTVFIAPAIIYLMIKCTNKKKKHTVNKLNLQPLVNKVEERVNNRNNFSEEYEELLKLNQQNPKKENKESVQLTISLV